MSGDADWVVVARLMAAGPPPAALRRVDRAAFVAAATAAGWSAAGIAARLGCAERSVTRWRAATRDLGQVAS